jgi:hypothetical protein
MLPNHNRHHADSNNLAAQDDTHCHNWPEPLLELFFNTLFEPFKLPFNYPGTTPYICTTSEYAIEYLNLEMEHARPGNTADPNTSA